MTEREFADGDLRYLHGVLHTHLSTVRRKRRALERKFGSTADLTRHDASIEVGARLITRIERLLRVRSGSTGPRRVLLRGGTGTMEDEG